MNEQIKIATSAARAYYEASNAFDEAKEALKPLAKQQLDIMARIINELGLRSDYRFRSLFYYDWIEFEIGGYYEGSSDTPVIEIQLWERGRGGDHDSCEGTFRLDQHIIDGEPEKFEAKFRAQHEGDAAKKARAERERTEREIAQLQAKLDQLKKD